MDYGNLQFDEDPGHEFPHVVWHHSRLEKIRRLDPIFVVQCLQYGLLV
jgi:hypothetical protein